ncbi:MAG: site-specific DNA-methyltransferase [Nitrospirae bacterium]|nr:site-specific DNA-methyltransferase [Nitrospirota bacterium]
MSKLIYGENLAALKTLLADYGLRGKVALVYIDPPFATNGEFKISKDRANTVSMSNSGDIAYSDTLVGCGFLEFLRVRLILLRELMSEKSSIYLHIDNKIGHYVKIIMDEIFGRNNFRNDITRVKCNPKNFDRRAYGNIKDMILFYSKSQDPVWNNQEVPFSEDGVQRLFKKIDNNGRRYTTVPLHAPGETVNGKTGQEWRGMKPPKGRHWRCSPEVLDALDKDGLVEWSTNGVPRKKIFADERKGKKMQDIWDFKDPQYPSYPTEKNLDMLKFIIQTSSNEGDLVLDCFCGSGTTLLAAEELSRRWIGIDSSEHAIRVVRKRLAEISTGLCCEVEYDLIAF